MTPTPKLLLHERKIAVSSAIEPWVVPTYADKAYVAGFFDGEGCVYSVLKRRRTGEVHRVAVLLSVGQNRREVLDWMCARWGGTVNERLMRGKLFYGWQTGNKKHVERFLRDVLPWLQVKNEQAMVALTIINDIDQLGAATMLHFKLKFLKQTTFS